MLSNNSLTEETEILLFSNNSNVKPYYCQIQLNYGLTVEKQLSSTTKTQSQTFSIFRLVCNKNKHFSPVRGFRNYETV